MNNSDSTLCFFVLRIGYVPRARAKLLEIQTRVTTKLKGIYNFWSFIDGAVRQQSPTLAAILPHALLWGSAVATFWAAPDVLRSLCNEPFRLMISVVIPCLFSVRALESTVLSSKKRRSSIMSGVFQMRQDTPKKDDGKEKTVIKTVSPVVKKQEYWLRYWSVYCVLTAALQLWPASSFFGFDWEVLRCVWSIWLLIPLTSGAHVVSGTIQYTIQCTIR
jgi:hypothetical protein